MKVLGNDLSGESCDLPVNYNVFSVFYRPIRSISSIIFMTETVIDSSLRFVCRLKMMRRCLTMSNG